MLQIIHNVSYTVNDFATFIKIFCFRQPETGGFQKIDVKSALVAIVSTKKKMFLEFTYLTAGLSVSARFFPHNITWMNHALCVDFCKVNHII